ncbi:MAG: hypothetical protein ACJAUV_000665 [Flavobacteriales bacterium]|jgi:hypothetical protein
MNMHILHTKINKSLLGIVLLVFGLLLLDSCKKEEEKLLQVETAYVQPPNAGKSKEKTEEQYVSIIYTNLFQKAISINLLVDYTEAIMSVGDKLLAHEILVSNFMNDPQKIIPSNTQMRADIHGFLDETYKRFYVRPITEAERKYFTDYINANPDVTAEHIYVAFALSNEYLFY